MMRENVGSTIDPDDVIEFTLLQDELGPYYSEDSSDAVYPLKALTGVLTIDSKTTARTAGLLSLGAGTVISPARVASSRA